MSGVCLNEEGSKLNRAYVDLPGQYSKRACLSECQRKRKSVGYKMSACEYTKDGSCKVHTLTASTGNLNASSTCCIYDSGNDSIVTNETLNSQNFFRYDTFAILINFYDFYLRIQLYCQ